MKRNENLRLIDDFESELIATVSRATFPIACGPKRFMRDLRDGYIKQLSDRGRWYLAYIAYRFRRQYTLTDEQWRWVNEWRNKTLDDRDHPASPVVAGGEDASHRRDTGAASSEDQAPPTAHAHDGVSLPLFGE